MSQDLSPAEKAVKYILDRIQRDPDARFYFGPATESFALLCAAEAARTGRSVDDVRHLRKEDLQPEYRRREAEVVELRKKVEHVADNGEQARERIRELEAEVVEVRAQLPDSRHCGHCGLCSDCGYAYPCVCPEPTEQPRGCHQHPLSFTRRIP